MHLRKLQLECCDARALLAILALLVAGLAGCATDPTSSASKPYVGTFTGEFVDGKPLYRFPTIEVVGSGSAVINDESGQAM